MRFGVCGNCIATLPDKLGFEFFDQTVQFGYDYVELPIAELGLLSDEQFEALAKHIDESPIRCEVNNNFVPASVRLTGPDADMNKITEYFKRALARSGRLGVKTVVFGSGGAKYIPAGFPYADAYKQLAEATAVAADIGKQYGITFAIEPIRTPDTNIIKTFKEGVELADYVAKDNVRVLVDYYHLTCNQESTDVLRKYGKDYLRHIHMSYPNFPTVHGYTGPESVNQVPEPVLMKTPFWRTFPSLDDDWDYSDFFDALKTAEYDGRMSIEAYAVAGPFNVIAPKALKFLREMTK